MVMSNAVLISVRGKRSQLVYTFTLDGPQDQSSDTFFPIPPDGSVWDVVSASVVMSSAKVLDSASQAYMYSAVVHTLPGIYTPNLDNYAYCYSDGTSKSVAGFGGYGTTPPTGAQTWIQWMQTLHLTSVLQVFYQAQLLAGEKATFTLVLQPESGTFPASALYQWNPALPIGPKLTVVKIPGSTPPAGSVLRLEAAVCAIAFRSPVGPPRLAQLVRQPDGFLLASIDKWNPGPGGESAIATGGYSSNQTGTDSGPGQWGTATVWTAEEYVNENQWVEYQAFGVTNDGGQFAILTTKYPAGI
jgi:hypothetical protein